MSISSTTNRNGYTGNDTTATYSYSFRIFLDTDIKVIAKKTSDLTETVLTKTTDYTVTGVGSSAGTVVLVDAGQAWISGSSFLDTGYTLSLRRVVGVTQITDIRNQGDFYPEAHEDEFDKSRMIDQQQQDDIDRSLKITDSVDPADFDATLPTPVADKFIKINGDATGWVYSASTSSGLTDTNIDANAAIQRTKLADGTADHVVTNGAGGAMSSEEFLAKARGGSGIDNSSVTFPTTGTIVTEAGTETLTNKTLTSPTTNGGDILSANIDGEGANGNSKIVLPKGTTSLIAGETRKEGTVYYDTDMDILTFDNGTKVIPAGTDASSSLDVFYRNNFSIDNNIYFEVTGNNATPDNAGTGSISGAVVVSSAKGGIMGGTDIGFLTSSSGTNDFFLSEEITVPVGVKGQQISVTFPYRYLSGANGDLRFLLHDSTNDTVISLSTDHIDATTSTLQKIFRAAYVIPTTCANLRFGFQRIAGDLKTLNFTNIEFSTKVPNLTETKTLAADIATTQDMASFTCTSLIVGKVYNIGGTFLSAVNSDSIEVNAYSAVSGGGTHYGLVYQDDSSSVAHTIGSGLNLYFTATSTSLYLRMINPFGGVLKGDGTVSESFMQLTECNDTIITTKF